MARTHLLAFFQQLYRDFEEADASGKSVAAVQDERRSDVSRRDFLKASGAVVTAAASFAKPIAFLAARQPRIVIIGGGIAGLNAALVLQDAGYSSTIYEASSRIGGRMHSDTTSWENGQVTEHCGELIDSIHKTILGLAKRFDINVADLITAEPTQTTTTYYFFGQYYLSSQANDDFDPVYHAVKADLNAAGYPTLYNNFTNAALALDNLSVYDWIEERVPGGHGSKLGRLLDVASNLEFGAETSIQSSLNLIYLLAFATIPGNFPNLHRSNSRYHMIGGNEQLPRAIAATLSPGTIQTETSLTTITKNADGTYTLGLKRGPSKFTVIADRVVLTLPFSVLRNLDYHAAGFNGVKNTAIQQLGYATNAKLHLQFNQRLWNQPGPWGLSTGSSYSDTGYQGTWEVTRGQSGQTGILVDYTGGNIGASFTGDSSKPSVVHSYALQFLAQVEPVFPGLNPAWNGRATLDTPSRSPYFLGSYSYWKKGQYTLIAGAERERSGNCHFAGEHCSINFQGLMEGAAEEGARAAGEILSDYKAGVFP
jgi:monoamine oxidase